MLAGPVLTAAVNCNSLPPPLLQVSTAQEGMLAFQGVAVEVSCHNRPEGAHQARDSDVFIWMTVLHR